MKMKTKSIISVILTIMMIVSMVPISALPANAATVEDNSVGDTSYYLWYGDADNPDNYSAKTPMTDNGDGTCSAKLSGFNGTNNRYFLINTDSTSQKTAHWKSAPTVTKGANINGGGQGWGNYYIVWVSLGSTSITSVKITYNENPSSPAITITDATGTTPPTSTTPSTTEPTTTQPVSSDTTYYIVGRFAANGNHEDWSGTTELFPFVSTGTDNLYKYETNKTVEELSKQIDCGSGSSSYQAYQYFYIWDKTNNKYYSAKDNNLETYSSASKPVSLDEVNFNDNSNWMSFSDTTDESGPVTLYLDTTDGMKLYYTTVAAPEGAYSITTSVGNSGAKATVTNTTHPSYAAGTANEGDSITVTLGDPNEKYTFDSISAKDKSGKDVALTSSGTNTYTFTMPAANVTVTAKYSFKKAEAYTTGLWVDVQPTVTESSLALIKWSNQSGPSGNSGTAYKLYIPSGVSLTSLPIYHKYNTLTIDGKSITSGSSYSLSTGEHSVVANSTNYTLTVYQSTSASAFTYTAEGDLPTTPKKNNYDKAEYTGKFMTANADGTINDQLMDLKQLKGRGNSSWESSCDIFGKYAYNIKLSDKIDPLDMGATNASSFCLLANNMDESLLRNIVTYQAATQAGLANVPKFKVIDLYNNGTYLGSYLITEKVDVGSDKLVNGTTVEADSTSDKTSATKTGTYIAKNGRTYDYRIAEGASLAADKDYEKASYLLEFDIQKRAVDELSWFVTPEGQYVTFKAPGVVSEAQMKYVLEKWSLAEKAIYVDNNYTDASTYMDLNSFAQVYLLQEFSKNLDSCATSYYIYYDGTQTTPKWKATPIWDYDWAFGSYYYGSKKAINTSGTDASQDLGNANTDAGIASSTSGWFAKYKYVTQTGEAAVTGNPYNLQAQLANMTDFWENNVKTVWNNGFYTSLVSTFGTTGNTDGYIYSAYTDNIASFEMNEARYGFTNSNPIASWGSLDTGADMEAAYNYLKKWGIARAAWMNEKLYVEPQFSVTLSQSASSVTTGTTLKLTATPDPADAVCNYTFYRTTHSSPNNADDVALNTASTTTFINIKPDTAGTYYYYVKATSGTTSVYSDIVTVTVTKPIGTHSVTVWFKSASGSVYVPSVKLDDGSYEEMTRVAKGQPGSTYIGTNQTGSIKFYWYYKELLIDSTSTHTLTFKTRSTSVEAKSEANSFSGDTYHFAVDNLMNDTTLVDLTGKPEHILNFHRSATHMVNPGLVEGDNTLGYTYMQDKDGKYREYAMGQYLPETTAVATSSVSLLASSSVALSPVASSAPFSITSATLAQKITADITEVSELQYALLDVNLDGVVDIDDATLMQKALVQ